MANGLVLFRVDASHFLGNGHIVRCVALAEALIGSNYTCVFVCRDLPGNAIAWLQQRFFDVVTLPPPESLTPPRRDDFTTWAQSEPQWDAHDSAKSLMQYEAEWIVVDHYAWSAAEHEVLQPLAAKILVIDDLCNRPLTANIIVDSGSRKTEEYRPWVKANSQLLLGRDFLPLRKSFYLARSKTGTAESVQRHFLISCGATDPENHSLKILNIILPSIIECNLRVTCVLAANAPHIKSVKAYCNQHALFNVQVDPIDMAELITAVDFVIGSAGSGIWERCALGKPSAVFMAGEDQRNNFNTLIRLGGGRSIAQEHDESSIDPDKLMAVIKRWYGEKENNQYSELEGYQQAARQLCGASGARRIVKMMARVTA